VSEQNDLGRPGEGRWRAGQPEQKGQRDP